MNGIVTECDVIIIVWKIRAHNSVTIRLVIIKLGSASIFLFFFSQVLKALLRQKKALVCGLGSKNHYEDEGNW